MDIDRLIRRDMEESLQKYEAEYNCLKEKYDQLKEDYEQLNLHYAAALDKITELESKVDDLKEKSRLDAMYCTKLAKTKKEQLAEIKALKKQINNMTSTHWMPMPQPPRE